jgi:hypothetical protein
LELVLLAEWILGGRIWWVILNDTVKLKQGEAAVHLKHLELLAVIWGVKATAFFPGLQGWGGQKLRHNPESKAKHGEERWGTAGDG